MWRVFCSVIFSVLLFFSCTVENNKTSNEIFKADAESLIQYEVPEWYADAKLGYWVTWGLKTSAYHRENYGDPSQFNHANGFDASDPSTQTLYGRGGVDSLDIAAWRERTTELAEKYHPDLYYFDWGWNISPFSEQDRLDFSAFYYNKALEWGMGSFPSPGVAVNYKSRKRLPEGAAVLDLEFRRSIPELINELIIN